MNKKRRDKQAGTHLEASAGLHVAEAQAVMDSLVGCLALCHLPPQTCCNVQVDWGGPVLSWGCCS